MSIAVLAQVYAEARRLAVAGSVVAHGDFRLKKLVPPLQQAGEKAPVFAKVAEAATAVIDGPEEGAAEALLELTALASAVLYTQGETGLPGELVPVETTDLGATVVQVSARVLKPLLEALTTTGSGRFERVKEAFDRGAFRDLRLVRPALAAIDDPYAEVADFIAEKVLPIYGRAVLPELRKNYDPKGTKGHPRRLTLMHTLDPAGTRALVKQALDEGSKDVKVAAIACLGADPEDLQFLLDQAAAKAQDVRAAAYRALAKSAAPAAVAVLEKALAGKDIGYAANAIEDANQPATVALLVKEITAGAAGLPAEKDKKKVSAAVDRLQTLVRCLPAAGSPAADKLLLDLFARRAEFTPIKGTEESGRDFVESVMHCMNNSDAKPLKAVLAEAHAAIDDDMLETAFDAGRDSLPAAKLFDMFSAYLTAKVDEKKKAKDRAWARREAVIDALSGYHSHYYWADDDEEDEDDNRPKPPPLDPRWLDLAVKLKLSRVVTSLAQPGHAAAMAYALAEFNAALKTAKQPDDVREQLSLLLRLKHPAATEAFLAAVGKRKGGKAGRHMYWFAYMIPRLPAAAIPQLEEIVPTLADADAADWITGIQKLRAK